MKFVKITNRAKTGEIVLLNSDNESLVFLCRWYGEGWYDVATSYIYRPDRFTHYCRLPKLPE